MKNISTRARLNIIFGVITVLILAFGLFLINKSMRSRTMVRLIYATDAANYAVCAAINAEMRYVATSQKKDFDAFTYLLDSTQRSLDVALESCRSIGEDEGEALIRELNAQLGGLRQSEKALAEKMEDDARIGDQVVDDFLALLEDMRKFDVIASEIAVGLSTGNDLYQQYTANNDIDALEKAYTLYHKLAGVSLQPIIAQRLEALSESEKELHTHAISMVELKKRLIAQADELSNTLDKATMYFADQYRVDHTVVMSYTIVILIIVIVFSILISQYTASSITRVLKQGVKQMEVCASGNFNLQIPERLLRRNDEFGTLARAIASMMQQVRKAIEDVKKGAYNVADASEQLNAVSQKISQGTSTQASSAEEVSSAMEEMAANIDQNAENALQTQTIAQEMEKKLTRVNRLSQQSLESVQSITQKIAIITEIASQTNILALNAAVEAARAGEHGRGFSVVASEIRKLAERSREAAAEIKDYSSRSLGDTREAAQGLDDVLPEVSRTAQLVQDIASACQEQRTGVDQINSAIQQLSEIIQQNAAASAEMATSAKELNSQATALNDASAFFVLS